jgi:metal-dependent amidase/aminoacylase/carboxypeptidase family protein
VIWGTLRFFNAEEGQKGFDILQSVFAHTAAMNKCTVEFDETVIRERPTINDTAKSEFARQVLGEIFPKGTLISFPKMYGTESFNNYLRKYPGVFAFIGVRNEKIGAGSAIHTDLYDMDESALETGVIATLKYALASLGC